MVSSTRSKQEFSTYELSATGTPSTLSLPPQTTPFTPAFGTDCTLSVYCKYLTFWNYDNGQHDLSGMPCQAVHSVGKGSINYNTACYPDGYFTLFDNIYGEIRLGAGTPTEAPGSSTVAYPGTECLSGWTTACTTTLTDGAGAAHSQAWCCPPGSWTCADKEQNTPGRYCASVMTAATDVWMSWDPPFINLDKSDYYTWTARLTNEDEAQAPTVYQRVFPLQLTTGTTTPRSDRTSTPQTSGASGTTSAPTDNPVNSDPTSAAPLNPASPDPTLSTGAIAGIVIGAVACILGAILGLVLLYRCRRRKHNGSGGGDDIDGHSGPDFRGETQSIEILFGGKAELPAPRGSVIPRAELAVPGSEVLLRAELDAVRPKAELDGTTVGPPRAHRLKPASRYWTFSSPNSNHNIIYEAPG